MTKQETVLPPTVPVRCTADHLVTVNGHGPVEPGQTLEVDRDLAERLVHEGRFALADKPPKTKKPASTTEN